MKGKFKYACSEEERRHVTSDTPLSPERLWSVVFFLEEAPKN